MHTYFVSDPVIKLAEVWSIIFKPVNSCHLVSQDWHWECSFSISWCHNNFLHGCVSLNEVSQHHQQYSGTTRVTLHHALSRETYPRRGVWERFSFSFHKLMTGSVSLQALSSKKLALIPATPGLEMDSPWWKAARGKKGACKSALGMQAFVLNEHNSGTLAFY